MKRPLKHIVINGIALVVISSTIGGIDFQNDKILLLVISVCLYLLNLIVKPLLNLLFMPINLITLGASRWIINLLIVFLLTIFVPTLKIIPVTLPPMAILNIAIPAISLSFFWTMVLISLALQFLISIFTWLLA